MLDWISTKTRKPCRDDADIYGCVLAVHLFQGVMVMGWREAADNSFVTYWTPTPEVPEDATEHTEQ